jgi:hypothetical protein
MRSPISSHFCFLLSAVSALYAQPSGGPYGPIDQRYELPKAAHVYYVAPDGKADSPGTTLEQPSTLDSAIQRVVTGDAIILRGGVYRTGGLLLNQGITLQPYADERPVLKGTQVPAKWEALRNNITQLLSQYVPAQHPTHILVFEDQTLKLNVRKDLDRLLAHLLLIIDMGRHCFENHGILKIEVVNE